MDAPPEDRKLDVGHERWKTRVPATFTDAQDSRYREIYQAMQNAAHFERRWGFCLIVRWTVGLALAELELFAGAFLAVLLAFLDS